jgi:predicted nucleic-acid-binding protein
MIGQRALQSDMLLVESEQEVFTAMIALKEGGGSFADALIGALDNKAGCSRTITFDQKALRFPGFELP